MLSKLKTLFTKQKEREWLTKPRHEIKLAFVHKGVEYFMFENEQNIVSERAFSAIDVYEELNQRITREYLDGYFAAVLAATNAGDLVKVANLTSNAMQRLAHITNVEILYKLASVLYFTKEENHYTYDREYNEKKIAKWKEDKDIDAFFLNSPMANFLPSFDGSTMNTQIYTMAQNKEQMRHLQYHLFILSESEKDNDLKTKLKEQVANLKKWNDTLA